MCEKIQQESNQQLPMIIILFILPNKANLVKEHCKKIIDVLLDFSDVTE